MKRTVFTLIVLCAAAFAASPAAAQKRAATKPKPEPAAEAVPCTCPDAAPAAPLREGGLAECTDGVDNDGDGHLDCTDQDCEIYAACVLPQFVQVSPAPPAAVKAYSNMRQLKADLRAGAISGHDFYRWQTLIRAWRASEIDAAKADLHTGRISHGEFKVRVAAIKLKYEG